MHTLETDQIYIYPVKSLGAVHQLEIHLCPTGMEFDRAWMIVNKNGDMISQREFPLLNEIKCTDEGDRFKIVLPGPNQAAWYLPKLGFNSENAVQVSLWNQSFFAAVQESDISGVLSQYLNTEVRIVHQPRRLKRFSVSGMDIEVPLSFQDSAPVHIVNYSSVDWLTEKSGTKVDPMQFRANLYVDLGMPFNEDQLDVFHINGIRFRRIKACERCIMVNLKPNSSEFGIEPLATLAKYRKASNKVLFGIYAMPELAEKRL